MQVIREIDDFEYLYQNSWAGALDTLDTIRAYDQEKNKSFDWKVCDWKEYSDERANLINILNDLFEEPIDETELNDYLWFERDSIFEMLGIPNEE